MFQTHIEAKNLTKDMYQVWMKQYQTRQRQQDPWIVKLRNNWQCGFSIRIHPLLNPLYSIRLKYHKLDLKILINKIIQKNQHSKPLSRTLWDHFYRIISNNKILWPNKAFLPMQIKVVGKISLNYRLSAQP